MQELFEFQRIPLLQSIGVRTPSQGGIPKDGRGCQVRLVIQVRNSVTASAAAGRVVEWLPTGWLVPLRGRRWNCGQICRVGMALLRDSPMACHSRSMLHPAQLHEADSRRSRSRDSTRRTGFQGQPRWQGRAAVSESIERRTNPKCPGASVRGFVSQGTFEIAYRIPLRPVAESTLSLPPGYPRCRSPCLGGRTSAQRSGSRGRRSVSPLIAARRGRQSEAHLWAPLPTLARTHPAHALEKASSQARWSQG